MSHTGSAAERSEEHTSELQSRSDLVCRLLLEKKKVLTTDDISVLRAAIEALNQEAQKIGVEMYGKGGPAETPPPGAGDSGGSADPSVVDADLEDVDKK